MAKVQNTFLKSKMNKDLDARIMPNGEYRDARNIQVSRSESSEVGALENILGNEEVINFETVTGVAGLKCIGILADEVNNVVYLYLTNNFKELYYTNKSNFIISHNTLSNQTVVLVKGAFLNFSTLNPIYGINILEGLLFWTDNRNQPRKIDVTLANAIPSNINPTYYQTEDQISVAKYNPYQTIELYQASSLSPGFSETTMKDVSSLFLPNGGSAVANGAQNNTTINITGLEGQINLVTSEYGIASKVYLQDSFGVITDTGQVVTAFTTTSFTVASNLNVSASQTIVFNSNPYYNPNFSGDSDYLEDKFVRFSYRFKFEGNEYSIFAPFTQTAFIPKQDGYFMYTTNPNPEKDDQADAYRSTVVYFVENKVDSINLRIPLPFNNYELAEQLKIKEVDILYKESDGLSVKVVDTIKIDTIFNSSAICLVDNTQTSTDIINVNGVQGGILIGQKVSGAGIPSGTVVASPGFVPTDPSNAIAGTLKLSNTVTSVSNDTTLTVGDIDYYDYNYNSTKPFKTLPESELIRVFDKVPVKALAQEISGNRVIYGNYQTKQTPPASLNYNVACTTKADFSTNESTLTYNGVAQSYSAGASISVTINTVESEGLFPGAIIKSDDNNLIIPSNTQISSTTSNTVGAAIITLNNNVTFPSGPVSITAQPSGGVEETTSIVEYPSSSVKTNRNYQIGFVLSDRFGRQSSVILSSNTETIKVGDVAYAGSTLYSPYINSSIDQDTWPGNSLKILLNEIIPSGAAGLYNGNVADVDYNPLGWYSYKIVVKQTEQEYYNVYIPGIMSAYPEDFTLELGKTSHTVLINDNINKVPRDLNEVGPEQRQFRSSVQLFGRVQNTATSIIATNVGDSNTQYYPGRQSDTVSTISTMYDLFDYSPTAQPDLNYFPQFYSYESNPLIARISTEKKIGQIATTNYSIAATEITTPNTVAAGSPIPVENTQGILSSGQVLITQSGVLPNTTLTAATQTSVTLNKEITTTVANQLIRLVPSESSGALTLPGLQYLAVYETEPVESLLDIFWETSSAGLISDLNSAVLNASDGAANISGWNTNTFIESLGAAPQDILNAPGTIALVDNFGISLTGTLVLNSVVNANNEQVNSSNPYFTLLDTGSGNGPWKIQTTSEYYNNIYFSSNLGSQQFTFEFTATANGTSSNIQKYANLGNVSPTIIAVNGVTPSNPNIIYTNTTVSVIATIDGVNGANNAALANSDLLYTLVEAKNSSLADVDYFSISQADSGSNSWRATLSNNLQAPIDVYTVTLNLQDAGDSETIVITIDFRIQIPQNYIFNRTREWLQQGEQVNDYYPFVILKVDNTVTGATPAQQGWYLFAGGWFTVYSPCSGAPQDGGSGLLQYTGSNFVTMPLTQPDDSGNQCRTAVGTGESIWYFSSVSQSAVEALMIADNPDLQGTGSESNGFNCAGSDPSVPNNPDISDVLFEVI